MSQQPYTREFYQGFEIMALESAREVVPIVVDLVRPTSVVDIGCGEGLWLVAFQESGVQHVHGLDGSYVPEDLLKIPRDRFQAADLGKPLDVKGRFDLAVSLEVAEHLPEPSADRFVSDLVRLAPMVLFSAAIPFQGGEGHVNEQWQQYWADLFATKDYVPIDCVRRRVWSNPKVKWYYAQNTILYGERQHVTSDPVLNREYEATKGFPLSLVHPTKYMSTADTTNIPLRRVLRQMPTLLYHGVRRTISGS
jgi:SAM-dependent methyltransferase